MVLPDIQNQAWLWGVHSGEGGGQLPGADVAFEQESI